MTDRDVPLQTVGKRAPPEAQTGIQRHKGISPNCQKNGVAGTLLNSEKLVKHIGLAKTKFCASKSDDYQLQMEYGKIPLEERKK